MNRLGLNGPNEVKTHPWLRDFPWDDLLHKRLRAPYIPSVSSGHPVQIRQLRPEDVPGRLEGPGRPRSPEGESGDAASQVHPGPLPGLLLRQHCVEREP